MMKVYCFNAWCSIDLPIETVMREDGSIFQCGGNYPETIQGERFRHFLDMCFEEATSFSLQKGLWQFADDVSLEQELAPYELETIYTKKWFLWDLSDAPEEDSWTMCQKRYRVTEETKKTLNTHFDEIFLGHATGKRATKNYTLEDLCFFKENVLFMGTKSHEFCLYVYPPDEVFEQEIKKLGVWEDVSAYMNEFSLPDGTL